MPENAKSPPEPSMEEIIASISRIITEDKGQAEPTRPIEVEKDEILELTEALKEDGSVQRIPPFEEKRMASGDGPNSAGGLPKANSGPSAEPQSAQREPEIEPKPENGRERIV